MEWTDLLQNMDMWKAIANGELLGLIKCAVCHLANKLLASQDGLYCMELSGPVSQLATYHKIFSFFFLVLLKNPCSCVHTSTKHSPCFPP
jgi:hypothetical protein